MLLHFIHSHFAVFFSAISEIVLIAFLFVAPTKSMSVRILQRDFAANSLVPTSIIRQNAFNSLLQHCMRSSLYFIFSLMRSFNVPPMIVNSYITIVFNLFKKNTKFGRKVDFAIRSWNFNLSTKSTLNSQSVASGRMLGMDSFFLFGFVLAVRDSISIFPGFNSFVRMAIETIFAITFNIWSYNHQ